MTSDGHYPIKENTVADESHQQQADTLAPLAATVVGGKLPPEVSAALRQLLADLVETHEVLRQQSLRQNAAMLKSKVEDSLRLLAAFELETAGRGQRYPMISPPYTVGTREPSAASA